MHIFEPQESKDDTKVDCLVSSGFQCQGGLMLISVNIITVHGRSSIASLRVEREIPIHELVVQEENPLNLEKHYQSLATKTNSVSSIASLRVRR